MNTVDELLKQNFSRSSRTGLDDKFRIKALGRPVPQLSMEQKGLSHGTEYMRKFNADFYEKFDWLCGCEIRNALFCFPCLLFGGEPSWTKMGVRDLRHIHGKAKKHEVSKVHMNNVLNLNVLGKVRLCAQSDSALADFTRRYNEEVKKNRAVLSAMIDVTILCGEFGIDSRDKSQLVESNSPGVFHGLLEYTAKLDPTLRMRLEGSVFESASATIHNDLLDCIFQVYQECVIEEIKNSQFVAVIAHEIMEVSNVFQMVIIFRYEVKGNPIERFWTILRPPHHDAETLTQCILYELETVLGEKKDKLIAQSYNGTISVLSYGNAVQERVRYMYPNAHFVHYPHQANPIAELAAASAKEVKLFFSNLSEIPSFFSEYPQCSAVLDNVVRRRYSQVEPKWNFKSHPVNVVYEYRVSLIECFEELESSLSPVIAGKASAFFRMLQDRVFVFWLTFFHNLMPFADPLLEQLHRHNLTSEEAKAALASFIKDVQRVRNSVDQITQTAESLPHVCNLPRREGGKENQSATAKEVCDIIKALAEEQFHFTSHLSAANLVMADAFEKYSSSFPEPLLLEAVSAYSMLDKYQVRNQLEVLYDREDCRSLTTAMLILQFIVSNNVERTFSEVAKLVRIILTTPMSSPEEVCSFSALQRVKTFLRNIGTVTGDRLNARTVLAVEKSFIKNIDRLNEQVIEKFATTKDRRIDLAYKST